MTVTDELVVLSGSHAVTSGSLGDERTALEVADVRFQMSFVRC